MEGLTEEKLKELNRAIKGHHAEVARRARVSTGTVSRNLNLYEITIDKVNMRVIEEAIKVRDAIANRNAQVIAKI